MITAFAPPRVRVLFPYCLWFCGRSQKSLVVLVKPANDTGRPALLAERLGLGRYYFPRPAAGRRAHAQALFWRWCARCKVPEGSSLCSFFEELQGP